MVVALDIDDTITRHPPFFALLTRALIQAGHQVIIITFRERRKATERDLAEWGIVYTELVTARMDELLVWGPDEWKAGVCRRLGVEVFFEDSPGVLQCLPPSVLGLMPVDPDRHRLDLLAESFAASS